MLKLESDLSMSLSNFLFSGKGNFISVQNKIYRRFLQSLSLLQSFLSEKVSKVHPKGRMPKDARR